MAKLFVVTQGLSVSSHDLGTDWVTIGRGDANNFQVVEPSISGRHCEVRVRGNELMVRDLLSTNGTFAGGKKVTEAAIKGGETFKLGDVEFRFEASPPELPGSPNSRIKVPSVSAKPGAPSEKAANAPSTPAGPARDDSEHRYHVLLVDDSLAFLEAFGQLFTILSKDTWQVHAAPTADRALAILQSQPIDLAVLDIGMPMVDGIQLLGIIRRRYPGLKIAVMTGHATEGNRAACLANGAELFIEKPASADDNKVVFNLLHDLVSWAHREGFSGSLRQVGLQEVVQMECIGGHSSILEIRNDELHGKIYVEAGRITHAVVGSLAGKQAFYRLLSLKGGEFQVRAFEPPPQRTVQDRWELLLMDAAKATDEETVMLKKASVAATATPPAPKPGSGDEYVVVATYEGKWIPADGLKK